ncbi:MAG: hypothetical protein A3C79_03370 [Candidatus Taylorbacteria bacterium RIFCSPHIGHO2_02_FULL_45_28]|nr:MAG: hypothetical protein A2830_01085 [Candidatus Taylorbacteria bacterium RIFCSPHIGHO2_01_FULL_44_110]OHA24997.1 MAG: hypothetical protein A3C79_03370 [Candidatus Taylorbacteria bacterium RIFCSPHIGHO2_02_FULL_45_28]OHA32758.1 MAG: hypothetical protein A3A23_00650 [Candidatus Taylorbacteria bacterium RIFCSPLOWO2_01_FULL_45_59]OHA39053.1 MAG: hypothetical protein A3I98_00235 [Candidatus Taylorbacteria bacterium RIFCSPLOWO2_02_FULL_45_10b]OHA44610.1 MAG: hypothetical protein A3G04_02220 [Candi
MLSAGKFLPSHFISYILPIRNSSPPFGEITVTEGLGTGSTLIVVVACTSVPFTPLQINEKGIIPIVFGITVRLPDNDSEEEIPKKLLEHIVWVFVQLTILLHIFSLVAVQETTEDSPKIIVLGLEVMLIVGLVTSEMVK